MSEVNSCFVIMPISDQIDYDKGHFSRVYEHLIKPACEKAGFTPTRADDESKTNYIVIDIIKKIIDSDIVICDLSAKNPNVLYELGIRQAFNKKSVLIKDNKTSRIFDIQGLRTLDYDENLRIDDVKKNIELISKTIRETYEAQDEDINSIIQLLSIKPASISDSIEISKDSSLILNAINDVSDRLTKLDVLKMASSTNHRPIHILLNREEVAKIGEELFDDANHNDCIGKLVDFDDSGIFIEKGNTVKKVMRADDAFRNITIYPF